MTYFKIIQNSAVVDAGYVFLKWNGKHNCMVTCGADEAEFIQSYNQDSVYHASWLKPVPEEAGPCDLAEAVVISETEFDEIRALLDDGETIQEEPETRIPVFMPEPHEETQAERPMTVAEMRQMITEQQEQIAMLTDCILEMSEIVYAG